jgi:twitching motility two-component system response regulator PilG
VKVYSYILVGWYLEVWKRKRTTVMSKLVMIIDDSLTVRKIMETSLKREGFASVSYPDGIEALRALNERRHPIPDLVLLDIGLPKMDGYEVARHLKTKEQFGNTTIVMLTQRDGMIDRLKGRLAGAKDYITKPFKTQEVMTIVHSHLSTPTVG